LINKDGVALIIGAINPAGTWKLYTIFDIVTAKH
jgi:hypothetical protein